MDSERDDTRRITQQTTLTDVVRSSFNEKFARAIYKNRWRVVVAWAVIFVVFSPFAVILVTQRCVSVVAKPVKGSESDEAFQKLKKYFPALTDVRTEKVEIRCVKHCSSEEWKTRAKVYVDMLTNKINEFGDKHPGSIIKTMSYFDMGLGERVGMRKSQMETMFLSKDGKAVLFTWIWNVPQAVQSDAEYFTQKLGEWIASEINDKEAKKQEDQVEVNLTGIVTLGRQMFVSIVEFFIGDVKNSWMNILVLAFALKNFKLTFLALIPMAFEIPLGIGILFFLSLGMDIQYLSALMTLQMITAMGWDYSLFTLTRYVSERANGLEAEDALVVALSFSSPLITISAIVLTISWSALFFMPEMFQAFAACSVVGVFVAAAANATLLPAILAIVPFLGPKKGIPPTSEGNNAYEVEVFSQAKQFMHGFYYTLAKYITQWPNNIIFLVCVYVIMMPFTIRCFENVGISGADLGHSYAMTLPRGRPEWSTAIRIQENFHPMFGVLMPTTVFATIEDHVTTTTTTQAHFWNGFGHPTAMNETLATDEYFRANCRMMNAIVDVTAHKPYAIDPTALFSPAIPVPDGLGHLKCHTYSEIDSVLEGRTGGVIGELGFLASIKTNLDFMWKFMGGSKSMLTVVNPSIDPLGKDAFKLMDDMRATLKKQDEEDQHIIPGIKRRMYGGATYYMDNILFSEKALPKVFLGCSFLSFLLIALNFKAAVIPVKLILTVIWPITWFFGIALMVYEDGVLQGLGIAGLSPGGDGLDWTVPMFSVTFMIGVALDYDYFLFERVYEFREQGFGDREAIQLGLSAQAITITCGGLILSFTFFSMITESAMPVTNQLGFMYFVGILIDTYLVRTVVTPALLSIGSWINYWPVVMDEPVYEWLDRGLDPLTDSLEPWSRRASEGDGDITDSESKGLLA